MSPEKLSKKRKSDTKISQQTMPSTPQIEKPFIEPDMTYIEEGTFQMGSDNGSDDEKPVYGVTVSSFYIGRYPVTNKEYRLYDSKHKNPGDNLPLVEVKWDDAVAYCQWLSNKTGKNYRLPTEAEWEYSCRAGTTTEYYWGNKINGDYCWYDNNSGEKVHPVGQKKPNAFGLYDMSGNIWEWCSDCYGDYQSGNISNPTGHKSGSRRILRGGGWRNDANGCRSANRHFDSPNRCASSTGFRLVRTT